MSRHPADDVRPVHLRLTDTKRKEVLRPIILRRKYTLSRNPFKSLTLLLVKLKHQVKTFLLGEYKGSAPQHIVSPCSVLDRTNSLAQRRLHYCCSLSTGNSFSSHASPAFNASARTPSSSAHVPWLHGQHGFGDPAGRRQSGDGADDHPTPPSCTTSEVLPY